MGAFDAGFGALAVALVGMATTTVEYTTVTGNAYDTATGKVSAGAPVTRTINISPPLEVENSMIDGDTVLAGDMTTIVADDSIDFTPIQNDSLVYQGTRYTVNIVKPIPSGDKNAAYKLVMRS